ncbi:MAG: DUF2161 family putative PD-(D/E)XK-type phosphodiesterase [Pseudomonadota bacterium]
MAERVVETDLYPPLKAYLSAQGYDVKGEIGPADLVARRGDEPPLIIELKTGFTLSLFHQAIERQALSEAVYIAAPRGAGAAFAKALKRNLGLARRLGLGLITIRLADGFVEVHADPGPFRPRRSPARRDRLLREFQRREGDPVRGGAARRGGPMMTAYRQDAMRCAGSLAASGPAKAADVAATTGVSRARDIMADDHYGWFQRISRGVYALTDAGAAAAAAHAGASPCADDDAS